MNDFLNGPYGVNHPLFFPAAILFILGLCFWAYQKHQCKKTRAELERFFKKYPDARKWIKR